MKKLWALVAIFIVGCHQAPALKLDQPWPTFAHDNGRTGRSDLLAPSHPVLKWRAQLGIASTKGNYVLVRGPVVDFKNTCYVLRYQTDVYAIDANGQQLWLQHVKPTIYNPILSAQGDLVCGGNELSRVTRSGNHKFAGYDYSFGKALAASSTVSHPLELQDGTLIVSAHKSESSSVVNLSSWSNKLVAVTSGGKSKWSTSETGDVVRDVLSSNGRLVVSVGSSGLAQAFDVKGHEVGHIADISYLPWLTPIVSGNAIYVVSRDRKSVQKWDATFNRLWSCSVAPFQVSSFALAKDGTLFVGLLRDVTKNRTAGVTAVGASGSSVWHREFPKANAPALTIDGKGTLLVSLPRGDLLALEPARGATLWKIKLANTMGPMVIGKDRTLFVLDRTGGLSAIGDKVQ